MEIQIPEDITEHEENILMGMNLRQTVLSAAGVAIISTSFFFTGKTIIAEVASWVSIFLGAPFFLFAFYKRDGMNLERYLSIWFQDELLSHNKRRYMAENDYYELVFKADMKDAKGYPKKTNFQKSGKPKSRFISGNTKRRKR